jgi:MoxR-like ATPase
MGAAVIGQEDVIRQMITALLANGHVLMESLPGLAKTRAVKSLAANLDAVMRRIQFTPDLLPSDLTGSEVLLTEGRKNVLKFQPGPIFGNVILGDEINRAPAKVQAALLEAMEERQITVAGTTYPMPPLFIVLATQNPIEQEGTYPLPEAQMDRFLMKVLITYPDAESERGVLALVRSEDAAAARATGASSPSAASATSATFGEPTPVTAPPVPVPATTGPTAQRLSSDLVLAARREINALHVADAIGRYVIDLVDATRHPDKYGDPLGKWISVGASPRGGISLDRASRATAWLANRDYVTPDDVRAVAHAVLRHRLILSYDANADGVRPDQVVDKLLEVVAVPA